MADERSTHISNTLGECAAIFSVHCPTVFIQRAIRETIKKLKERLVMKPNVRVIKQINPKHADQAKALANSVRTQVAALDKRCAWPVECGKFEIVIVNSVPPPVLTNPVMAPTPVANGETAKIEQGSVVDSSTYAKCMEVRWNVDPNAPLSKIRRDPAAMMHLAISVELMTTEAGASLASLGAQESDVIFHLLAHEIHHLNEAERLIECTVERGDRHNGLAKAVRKELPLEWIDSIKHYSEHHGPSKSIPMDDMLVTAGHIADEACTDMTGLHWLNADERDWKTFAKHLVEFRDIAAIAARQKLGCVEEYEIAPIIEALCLNPALPTLPEIQAKTMQLAIEMALASPLLHPETRLLFSQLGECPKISTRIMPVQKNVLARLLGR